MGEETRQFDAGHLSFLELVDVITTVAGPAFASGALLKTGLGIAKKSPAREYPDLAALVAAIEAGNTAISAFEGQARHYGDGVFGLPTCPFASSVKTYKGFVGTLPAGFSSVTEQYNKPSATTEKLRVGHQAGVSPFCCVHQTLRSAIADNIHVGGKPVTVYQLGCKSGSGVKGIADNFLQATGVSKDRVSQVLDDNMCCYLVTTT